MSEIDNQCLHWGEKHRGCDALYKDLKPGDLFQWRRGDGVIFRKYASGYKYADISKYPVGVKPYMFKTGQRTAVCTVAPEEK